MLNHNLRITVEDAYSLIVRLGIDILFKFLNGEPLTL